MDCSTQVLVLWLPQQQEAVSEGTEGESISQMYLAQMFPGHGSAPMSEKHPRSMHNFIRIQSYSSTNLQLWHQLVAQSTVLCHLSLSMSVAVKKNPDADSIPTSLNIPETKLHVGNQLSKDLNTHLSWFRK